LNSLSNPPLPELLQDDGIYEGLENGKLGAGGVGLDCTFNLFAIPFSSFLQIGLKSFFSIYIFFLKH